MQLVLASASPRRLELLYQLGIVPLVEAAGVDETVHSGEDPLEYVERVARAKCAAVAEGMPNLPVVAADTTVTIGGEILGKPRDDNDAVEMLLTLSGRTHDVLTAVAVAYGNKTESKIERTAVTFAELTIDDALWYVRTREPMDKAGSYAIQGAGGTFVRSIEGSVDNVIGLPRHLTDVLLGRFGLGLLDFVDDPSQSPATLDS
jgi:septum formation protein